MNIPIAEIQSDNILVWDHQISSFLYNNGFYGKPIGIRKPTPGEINRPALLSYFDGMYLQELGKIRIRTEGTFLSTSEFLAFAEKHYENFSRKYQIYKSFRNMGYIVRPGLKFGGDFVIYVKGPSYDHSKYVVQVESDKMRLRAINIVRVARLAHSVKKEFLVATYSSDEKARFYSFTRAKL